MNNTSDGSFVFPEGFIMPDKLSGKAPDTPILIGFSGGADSRLLFHLLCEYSRLTGAPVYAAHVNHGIRGTEADRDMEFCRKTANESNIPLFVLECDVPSEAKRSGDSLEGAGRRLRYDFFSRVMNENNISLLALAHNADDNLETVIYNMLRGSGTRGMCSILPSREMSGVPGGKVIRPLLNLRKLDIVTLCDKYSLEYVTDATNASDDCMRNKIRHRIIPELEQLSDNPQAAATRMTSALTEDCDALDAEATLIFGEKKRTVLPLSLIGGINPAIVKRVILQWLTGIGVTGIESVHFDALMSLISAGVPHSSAYLPGGIRVSIENGALTQITDTDTCHEYDIILRRGFNILPCGDIGIFIGNTDDIPSGLQEGGMNFLPVTFADISCESDMFGRSRKPSDSVKTCGINKSLKKIFNERHIPLYLRARIPVIYDNNGILLIPGCAVADRIIKKNIRVTMYFSGNLPENCLNTDFPNKIYRN